VIALGWTELFVYVLPISVGILAAKRWGRVATFLIMCGVLYLGCIILRARLGSGFLGPLAFFNLFTVSPTSLVPVLLFALVAGNVSRRSARR
jgi:hypothetical protein